MVRRIGFGDDETPPPAPEAPEAPERLAIDQSPPPPPPPDPRDGVRTLILFFVVLGLAAGGISVLLFSLSQGNLYGIVAGAIFSVATLSTGGSALIKRLLGQSRRK